MKARLVLFASCCLLVIAGACRSGGRRPRAVVPPVPDSVAERLRADSIVKAREDSIRAATQAPATPPAAPAPQLPPKSTAASEPERQCTLDLTNTPQTRFGRVVDPATGTSFNTFGGGIAGNCRGQNIRITADSAESYDVNDLHLLIGSVRYRETKYEIDADRVTYFRAEERLLFQGNVHARMIQDAATLDGPQLEYWRPVRGLRIRERVIATQRPRLTYAEKDSAGRDQPPMVVLGNTIVSEGDSTFVAVGDVRLDRGDVTATADSALLDGARRFSRLMRRPVVESRGQRPFTLKGRVIEMYGAGRQLDRVVAIDSGRAVASEFTVVSDTIDLRLSNRQLHRAFAFGSTGARATTTERDIIADSLDILMPGQRIQELRAIGKAYAESDPDSARIISDERDWIRGDTLIARFDSIAPNDTTQPRIRDLYASGSASAYYQMAADTARRSKPGINYVTGRVIRLSFNDREVETVTVTDQASGIYLEPLPADSVRRPPAATIPPRRPPEGNWRQIRGNRGHGHWGQMRIASRHSGQTDALSSSSGLTPMGWNSSPIGPGLRSRR